MHTKQAFKTLVTTILLASSATIAGAQNVGINTTSPTANLDINGSLRIRTGSPGLGKVLVSDASGNTSWKHQRVAFRAKGIQPGGLNNIAYNTWYRLYFDDESYDYGNNFLLDNNSGERSKFTVPVNGVYHFSASTVFGSRIVSLNTYAEYQTVFMRLQITRNGVTSTYTERRFDLGAETFGTQLSITDDIRLFAGDKIWVEIKQWTHDEVNMPMYESLEYAGFACHLVFED